MQTLNQMSDAELLAWAREALTQTLSTTILKTLTLSEKAGNYPPESHAKFWAYGFQRWHNDGLDVAETHEGKLELARTKFADAKLGKMGRTRGESVDPFMTIVLRVVRQAVKAKNADYYKKTMAGEKPDDVFKVILSKHQASNTPQYQAIMAKANLLRKQQVEAAALSVDGDL